MLNVSFFQFILFLFLFCLLFYGDITKVILNLIKIKKVITKKD